MIADSSSEERDSRTVSVTSGKYTHGGFLNQNSCYQSFIIWSLDNTGQRIRVQKDRKYSGESYE